MINVTMSNVTLCKMQNVLNMTLTNKTMSNLLMTNVTISNKRMSNATVGQVVLRISGVAWVSASIQVFKSKRLQKLTDIKKKFIRIGELPQVSDRASEMTKQLK